MNDKLKKVIIPFVIMLVFDLGTYYLTIGKNFGRGYSPHTGLLLIFGLLLGPYGAIGSVSANFISDIVRGYNFSISIPSAIISFGVSYLAYKLWYDDFGGNFKITKPKLDNIHNVLMFLLIILICAISYSIIHVNIIYFYYPSIIVRNQIGLNFFVNFVNSSFIYGIIGIWIAKRFDFIHSPQKSKRDPYNKLYFVLGLLLIISLLIILSFDFIFKQSKLIVLIEAIILLVLLYLYLTKPFTSYISESSSNSILENIMNRFLLMSLIIVILAIIISSHDAVNNFIDLYLPGDKNDVIISMLLVTDALVLIFLIPSISVLRYIENKAITPIVEFSQIENFISQNQKIESNSLLNLYSKYTDEENEIGILARSYSDLIKNNNQYIDNIYEIEGEKKRIEAELDIATKIQQSNLPNEAIDNEDYFIDGFSKPAKEVGGDFFDYYILDDDNIVFVIGDASGKGIPAAILILITQINIKQFIKHTLNPSEILYALNNQLCENNTSLMFITLWIGIYNKQTKKLTFSNAGHNPPLIKQNGKFDYLKMDSGIVLGVMEDFEFKNEETFLKEILVYTDGITDANNKNGEMYGEDSLIEFLNNYDGDNPINPLLNDLYEFSQDAEQFDDMTLLYLKVK